MTTDTRPPVTHERRLWAIVVAAGRGERFGGGVPKQYALLNHEPLVIHSLNALCAHPSLHAVLVGLSPDDHRFGSLGLRAPTLRRQFVGGDQRFVTVMRGLEAVVGYGGEDDWVLVHDAARPLVSFAEIQALVDALDDDSTGAVLGLPAIDAMKRVDEDSNTCGVVERSDLWRALTPQAFKCKDLLSALNACRASTNSPLDECEAMQRQGKNAQVVPGRNTNIKITTSEDLALAHAIVQMQL